MKYKNLITIGTSHIAKQSLEEVRLAIELNKPDYVALELDRLRLMALMSNRKRSITIRDIMKIGVKGFIFSLIGAWVEKKLGQLVGVAPGSEMKLAAQLAHKQGAKIALIDQNIEITLKRFSKFLTWREKFRFIIDILKTVFFRKREMEKLGIKSLDLTKVPAKRLIKKLTKRVKERYPNVYKVLIDERNHYMTSCLYHLMTENPDKLIIAVVGAGHEEDMMDLLKQKFQKKAKPKYK